MTANFIPMFTKPNWGSFDEYHDIYPELMMSLYTHS